MNKAKLKAYAPQARKDFIAAVTARAHQIGLAEKNGSVEIAPAEKNGDFVIIAGQSWPAKISQQRANLIARIDKEGFTQTIEAVAYTWFNRFAALRYMEIHDYLGHGYRALSSREGGLPEILNAAPELAQNVGLPGLNAQRVIDLKLAGDKDGELYRLTLIAQCNALSKIMPFLFERIDNETELLLPDNLLLTDSVIAKLVEAIPEEDWQEVEIVGWLYQFYISEKKDQVIGKVVKSEDIPAATQLFTPNWIVKYLVQNSLGAQWLATYPESPLKGQMEYYIEPAEQTYEVNAQLAAITPSQLNPEELALIDPASGSGHILVEAYELFKAIYLERGYRQRDFPQLILEKNLFGLDIDERAAQLTGFALMMKGRADDRRLFERGVKLNVMALVDSAGFDAEGLAKGVELSDYGLKPGDLTELKRLFEHATTFGSLIQVPEDLAEKLTALKQLSETTSQDLFVSEALKSLGTLVQQADFLAAQYDAVVANPPYMGRQKMAPSLKMMAQTGYPSAKVDLYACFMDRSYSLARNGGMISMVTMQGWMFLSTFEGLRRSLLETKTIETMAHIGYNSFPSLNSKIAQAAAFSLLNAHITDYLGAFINLNSAPQAADKNEVFKKRTLDDRFDVAASAMTAIPGSPIAYQASGKMIEQFAAKPSLEEASAASTGLSTGDNVRFLRLWHEVSKSSFGLDFASREAAAASGRRWFPYSKGGDFRKWFGNREFVIDWANDGRELKEAVVERYGGGSYTKTIVSEDKYFQQSVSMSMITTGTNDCRYNPVGALPDCNLLSFYGLCKSERMRLLGFLNSNTAIRFIDLLSPTIKLNASDLHRLPYAQGVYCFEAEIDRLMAVSRSDWNAYERSWDFQSLPLLTPSIDPTSTLESSYTAWITQNRDTIAEMKRLEEENNRLFIDAYGLADELSPDVPIEQITLTVNPAYRYGGKLTEEEQWTRFRQDSMEKLVSFAIGCMMGRYSLDEPGLIYAHAGNVGFDHNRYNIFPSDADGIVPITDELWFEDDAANRLNEFLLAVWDAETLEENKAWLAESLGQKGNETSQETIRRYIAGSFYKTHLQTYKKRPIYWLFSSGKQGAFQALVYLHRYNESTLSRMRAEYVVPLTGKIQSRIDMLKKDADAATSNAEKSKLGKDIDKLGKKYVELLSFDEKLRHYADLRIQLDLDDGVKVNYGKFGDLLAEVKAVTGGASDD